MKTVTITGIMADFLDSIRAYEHESGKAIHFDERESSEFVNMYFNNGGKLKIEEKEPLFITDDGVDIFDLCQTVYLIHPKTFIKQKSDLGYFSTNDLDNNKVFYYETNADEYIWKNKRVFSYDDMMMAKHSVLIDDEHIEKATKKRVMNE